MKVASTQRHMIDPAVNEQLALIRIDGMHCHKCEQKISKALSEKPGVHEVEVDFNSKLASVLFDPALLKMSDLQSAVDEAGYEVVSFTQSPAESKP
jgi:copper chaperone CopZ